jgi:hypothetical protein
VLTVGQILPAAAVRAASLPDRPDPLDLWRIADRVARHAEIRVAPGTAASAPATAEAVLLRQRANELLRAALGDFDGSVRELRHTAQTLRT